MSNEIEPRGSATNRPGDARERPHLARRARDLIERSTTGDDDTLLTTPEVAKWLSISAATLEIWRFKGLGPRFVRPSPTLVRYRRGDVLAWLATITFDSAAQYRKPRPPGSPRRGRPPKSTSPERQP